MRAIIGWIAVRVLWGLALLLAACCPTKKCPVAVPKVITVESNCQLPPAIKLPRVYRVKCGKGSKALACYDRRNAARLAQRQSKMRDWIKEARIRCGSPASQPAKSRTQPGQKPDKPGQDSEVPPGLK